MHFDISSREFGWTDFDNFGCFGKLWISFHWFSGFLVFSTSALLIFKSICAKKCDLLVWLSSPEVDFPTSDDFSFTTILKTIVRRVFSATKLRNRVPGTLPSDHELMRSWAKNQILVHLAFGWVTIELWGALPDLAWFFFLHRFKDECQARLLRYQAPESGTGNPLYEPRTEEVVSQRSGVQYDIHIGH